MIENVRIGDLIEVPSVQTVIRLESGKKISEEIVDSFVFTSEVESHIHVFSQSLMRNEGQGYFLQGDFGSGKSHFLSALSAWLQSGAGSELLTRQHHGLTRLKDNGRSFLSVPVSLVNFRGNTPLENIIADALEEEMHRCGIDVVVSQKSQFLLFLRQVLKDKTLATEFCRSSGGQSENVMQWIDDNPLEAYSTGLLFAKSKGIESSFIFSGQRNELFTNAVDAVADAGFSGVVLLIDELSEFFRSKPDSPSLNEDARTLQLLGEISRNRPFWIIAAVQESVERTGDIAQSTFRKIKDRFPHKMHLSTLHIRDLISKRLVRLKPDSESNIFEIHQSYCSHFPGFKANPTLFRNIYPVHPLTLSLLEGLGDLFSQHRGIVDFVHSRVAGDPSRGIEGILDRPCTELLSPDAIYEHFSSRIAEYSSFHIYPSQVVPHLDQLIGEILEDEEDQVLARKLIRILVLYAIHPIASPPNASMLAELVSCMLSFQDSQANVQYVAEVLLDPLVEKSRFLVKNESRSGDVADTTYSITTREDQGKILRMRIERVIKDMGSDDSRLYNIPLSEMPESFSWPGPAVWNGHVERTITWRQSVRKASVFFVQSGNEEIVSRQIESLLADGNIDFTLVICTQTISLQNPHTALWQIDFNDADKSVLKEYFACRTIAADLKEKNPADLPLIPQIAEQIRKLEPAVRQIVLQQIYGGKYSLSNLDLEPAARQLKRFDRILEVVGEQLLETRYPRFKEIASRGLPPSLRIYQRIFEEFICVGSIGMREARSVGLADLIETLAVPLGIVDVKAGSYLVSPNPAGNQFLSYFLSQIPSSGNIPLRSLMRELSTGPYGVPRELTSFLLCSLAYCGHISLISRGRSLSLDYIKLTTVDQVDAVACGEIISQADRETILESCPFLLSSGGSADSFGLRQQREAWQAVLKFKTSAGNLVSELQRRIQTLSGYSAFSYLDLDEKLAHCEALTAVLEEIKVSYSAREGLERFLQAWRESGLKSEIYESLKQVHRFLSRHAERMVFVNHYINHRSVIDAAAENRQIGEFREALAVMLRTPEIMILPDEGEGLQCAFERFRESYGPLYIKKHALAQKVKGRTPLTKNTSRSLKVIRSLASVPSLDRPRGAQQLLDQIEAPVDHLCNRNVAEELLRSPVCGCGYQYGSVIEKSATLDPEAEADRILREYHAILGGADVLESLSARAFALRDTNSAVSERLQKLHAFIRDNENQDTVTLRDLLDEVTVREISFALSGRTRIECKELKTLLAELSGRRLTPSRIREIVELWIGNTTGDTILSIDQSGFDQSYSRTDPVIWPCIHGELFGGVVKEQKMSAQQAAALAAELEQKYPSDSLIQSFNRMSIDGLVDFTTREPLHLQALQSAFTVLVSRILQSPESLTLNYCGSRFLEESEAGRINYRLSALKRICSLLRQTYPDRLKSRLEASVLYTDSWTSSRLKSEILSIIDNVEKEGDDWFLSLPAVKPLQFTDPVTVILVDAVPVDVWLEVFSANKHLFQKSISGWFRATAPSHTVDCINEIFGLPQEKDPATELFSRGVDYVNISGDEDRLWSDVVPPARADVPQLIRLSLFDKQAHSNGRLSEMPLLLSNLLSRNLPSLVEASLDTKRKLLLTSDHGLSFGAKGLYHGSGGLFEQTIFRSLWS